MLWNERRVAGPTTCGAVQSYALAALLVSGTGLAPFRMRCQSSHSACLRLHFFVFSITRRFSSLKLQQNSTNQNFILTAPCLENTSPAIVAKTGPRGRSKIGNVYFCRGTFVRVLLQSEQTCPAPECG